MGEFYKDGKEEPEEKKVEYIEDAESLLVNFEFENKRYQQTLDRDEDSIIPLRHELLGDDTAKMGLLDKVRKHIMGSKIGSMDIGHKMKEGINKMEDLADVEFIHTEALDEHIEKYQFLCKSGLKIIDKLYGEIEELKKQVGKKQQHITESTESEDNVLEPSEQNKGVVE